MKRMILLGLVLVFLLSSMSCDTTTPSVLYTLTIQTEGNGQVEPSSGTEYKQGTMVTLKVFPEEGWEFHGFAGEHGYLVVYVKENQYQLLMDDHRDIKALFTQVSPPKYLLSLQVQPQDSGIVTGDGEYEEGAGVTVSAEPVSDYAFIHWTKENEVVSLEMNFEYTMPGDHVILVAHFAKCEPKRFTLIMEIIGEGSVILDPLSEDGTYEEGTIVTLKAIPSESWHFIQWIGDVEDNRAFETTTMMDQHKVVEVVFEEITPQIESIYGQNGFIEVIFTPALVEKPSLDDFVAYFFVSSLDVHLLPVWPYTREGRIILEEDERESLALTELQWDGDQTIRLSFEPFLPEHIDRSYQLSLTYKGGPLVVSVPFIILAQEITIISITPVNSIEVLYGTEEEEALLALAKTTTIIDSTEKEHIVELSWSIEEYHPCVIGEYTVKGIFELPEGVYQTDPPIDLEVLTNITVLPPMYTLTMELEGSGTVTPPEGTHLFEADTIVPISATADPGYIFKEWSGDVEDPSQSETTLLMDEDKRVKAIFIPMIEKVIGENGMIQVIFTAPLTEDPSIDDFSGQYQMVDPKLNRLSHPPIPLPSSPLLHRFLQVHEEEEFHPLHLTHVSWDGDGEVLLFFEPFLPQEEDIHYLVQIRYLEGEYVSGDEVFIVPAEEQYTLTIIVIGEGTTIPPVGSHVYGRDTVVDLTATPEQEWTFSHWIGEVTSTHTASTTVLMDKDKIITVIFVDEYSHFLQPGERITSDDGVSIGAPEGVLDDEVIIRIKRVDDLRADVPFPQYLNNEVVGSFYQIRGAENLITPYDQSLLLGLPVPEGVEGEDLILAILTPDHWIVQAQPREDPSIGWGTLSGYYDEETRLYGTVLPGVMTEPLGFVLLQETHTTTEEVQLQYVSPGGFLIECVGFQKGECIAEHKEFIGIALDEAYTAYVEDLGFLKPRLQQRLLYISFETLEFTLGPYTFELRKDSPNGGYNHLTYEVWVDYEGLPHTPEKTTAYHELFHAVQNSYGVIEAALKNWAKQGILEGTAVIAENSLEGFSRSNLEIRDPLPIRTSIFMNKMPGGASRDDYRTQDFWVYVGKRMNPLDPDLSLFISLFETGWTKREIESWLKNDGTFNGLADAYWQFVRDYAFEKQVQLGEDSRGNRIPEGHPGEWWSALGSIESNTVTFDPATDSTSKTGFYLGPLSSRAFRLILKPDEEEGAYKGLATIQSDDPSIQYRFYDGTEETYIKTNDNKLATIHVEDHEAEIYLLVSNTNFHYLSGNIQLAIEKIQDQPGEEKSYYIHDINMNMRLARGTIFPKTESHDYPDSKKGEVKEDYWIGETPVTYELWYTIRKWAEEQGFIFTSSGAEGSGGYSGPPTDRKKEPVVSMRWYDTIIWCNALSEYLELEPVYISGGEVIRDATQYDIVYEALQRDTNGFRLPTSDEWELAARYQGSDPSYGAIEYPSGSGSYWTPGSYASGATGPAWQYDPHGPADVEATKEAAWYKENSHGKTQDVGQKPPQGNQLGLLDMSGNVWEWTFTRVGIRGAVTRGGSFSQEAENVQISSSRGYHATDSLPEIGLRLVTKYDPTASTFYTLTIEKSGEGRVEPEGKYHSYNEGRVVSLKAIPASCWEFKEWIGDVADKTLAETTITIDQDKTVRAIFEELPPNYYWLNIQIEGEGVVDVEPAPEIDGYLEGTVVTLTAVPQEGSLFKSWEGDVADTMISMTTITMDKDKEVKAIFQETPYYHLSIEIEGEGRVELEPEPEINGYEVGTLVTMTAIPEESFMFFTWEGDVLDRESLTTTVIMDSDKEIKAIFVEIYYSLEVMMIGQGMVEKNPLPEERGYREGTLVTLTATPQEEWVFYQWEGLVENPADSTTTIRMDQDQLVIAIFDEEESHLPDHGEKTSHEVGDVEFSMRLSTATSFPMGRNDDREGSVKVDVWVAETPVTYELWYSLKLWALENEYVFANQGKEGSNGSIGREPSSSSREPVTFMNWYDSLIWCNALSEYLGYEPVYTISGEVLKDATIVDITDIVAEEDVGGFALPTSEIWELAARTKGKDSSHGAIEYPPGSGRYFTPGDYASGAYGDYMDQEATKEAAWYRENSDRDGSGQKTQEVGQKPTTGNGLGLFDMSGNVLEWCFTSIEQSGRLFPVLRGGSSFDEAFNLQVGLISAGSPEDVSSRRGFRVVRRGGFDPKPPVYVTLTMEKEGEGHVYPEVGEHEYRKGTVVILTATAHVTGYPFQGWEGDVKDKERENTTITMDEGKRVRAIFKANLHPPVLLSPGKASSPGELIESKTPTLYFEGVEEATHYSLTIREEPYGLEDIVYHVPMIEGSSHTVPENTLENNKSYCWSMQAFNEKEESPISNILYFKTQVEIDATIERIAIIPQSPTIHEEFTLEMTFTNTGLVSHTFLCQVNLWEPGSPLETPFYVLEQEVKVDPEEDKTVTWSYEVTMTGDWAYQFTIWREKPSIEENRLAVEPFQVGTFTVTREPVVPGEQVSYTIEGVEFFLRLVPDLSFPTMMNDSGSATVHHPYWVAETEVTYDLWYVVYRWAIDNSYIFSHKGMEGSHGSIGNPPSHKREEPVTSIDWYHAVVWCNALSELLHYDPVYTVQGEVLKDATSTMIGEEMLVYFIEQEERDGFRLPTSDEWELAARYKGSNSSYGAIEYPADSGYYWTPGNYASGARGPYTDEKLTMEAAWYRENSKVTGDYNMTQNVGQKPSSGNKLGIFDMSGNVREFCFDEFYIPGVFRVSRGGCYNDTANLMQVGLVGDLNPLNYNRDHGFRLVRSMD